MIQYAMSQIRFHIVMSSGSIRRVRFAALTSTLPTPAGIRHRICATDHQIGPPIDV